MKKIDNLESGQAVRLQFNGKRIEAALFVSMIDADKGDDRRARFVQIAGDQSYEWDAYRYNGGWAYGSSAQRLSLVEVL